MTVKAKSSWFSFVVCTILHWVIRFRILLWIGTPVHCSERSMPLLLRLLFEAPALQLHGAVFSFFLERKMILFRYALVRTPNTKHLTNIILLHSQAKSNQRMLIKWNHLNIALHIIITFNNKYLEINIKYSAPLRQNNIWIFENLFYCCRMKYFRKQFILYNNNSNHFNVICQVIKKKIRNSIYQNSLL